MTWLATYFMIGVFVAGIDGWVDAAWIDKVVGNAAVPYRVLMGFAAVMILCTVWPLVITAWIAKCVKRS